MAIDREIIYLGRDNTIDLVLKSYQGSSGVTVYNLSGVTEVKVTFGSGVTVSSKTSPTLFSGVTSTVGALTLKFGTANLTTGKYNSEVIVYDSTNPNGIVWGDNKIPIIVKG